MLETLGRYNLPYLSASLLSGLIFFVVAAFLPMLAGKTVLFYLIFPGVYISSMVVNYFIFLKKRKYRRIVMSFRPELTWQKVTGRVGLIAFIMLMFAIILVT